MKCRQIRECLFVFLDSELDAAASIRFQRHIEHCPGCAREVEIERGDSEAVDVFARAFGRRTVRPGRIATTTRVQ